MSHRPKLICALSFILVITNLLFLFCKFSNATDTLTSSQSIVDGQTLVSKDGIFELGFFSPGSSGKRYLGIWYKKIPVRTVVWVANRINPINDSTCLLMIDSTSKNLVLINSNNGVVWSSSNSTKEAQNPVVQLLDSGNLVLRDGNNGNSGIYLWQSFDYPTDTLLAGMKIGVNLKTGLDRRLTSWKNWDDPSPGDLVWRLLVLHNYNAESTLWKGSKLWYRSGPWNGITYSFIPQLSPIFEFYFVQNEEEVYYICLPKNKSITFRTVINETSNQRELYTWDGTSRLMSLSSSRQVDSCDEYGRCGAYGNCIITLSPVCQCLKGFNPKSPEKWNSAVWSQGCIRNNSLNCKRGDGFFKFNGIKLPDTTYSWLNESMNLNECQAKCLQNCSCTAYSSNDIRNGGSGCILWFNDLIDIREIANGAQDLHVRMSASELAEPDVKHKPRKIMVITITSAIAVVSGIVLVSYYFYSGRKKLKDKYKFENNEAPDEDMDLLLFDLATISRATNKFSLSNKLGQGGFGPVYKGTLLNGQEIAVKRLSSNCGQGLIEFKNEVILIAKLQHRNLVKLLGCCIQGNERLLIYEYMPNKSLDYFIFDQTRGKLLDWSKRFNIMCAIARGLLYLHQDSRLRIIHRDLKASNVLLDNEMNPKISDFGMARIFGGDQTEGNTKRVVGTYGYMAPEYASDGLFSVKSDVFSFGILMLEITTGKRSRGLYHQDHNLNLIGYAWRLWNEGNDLELVEPFLMESCHLSEVKRCIHISLLCVQQHAEDRPSVASVVLMLGSKSELPLPKKPGFLVDRSSVERESPSSKPVSSSTNEISLSMLQGR